MGNSASLSVSPAVCASYCQYFPGDLALSDRHGECREVKTLRRKKNTHTWCSKVSGFLLSIHLSIKLSFIFSYCFGAKNIVKSL